MVGRALRRVWHAVLWALDGFFAAFSRNYGGGDRWLDEARRAESARREEERRLKREEKQRRSGRAG
jgi:hypothetical protein